MPNVCPFPRDLARAPFGAAAWFAPDGRSAMLERTVEGFEGSYSAPDGLSFVATWVREPSRPGLPPSLRLSAARGPGADAMDRAGIPWETRHSRIMDALGACAMMAVHSASVDPDDLQSLRSGGRGDDLLELLGAEPVDASRRDRLPRRPSP